MCMINNSIIITSIVNLEFVKCGKHCEIFTFLFIKKIIRYNK